MVVSFSNWYNNNYINFPNIHKDDIKDLMNIYYSDHFRKSKGWVNLKLFLKLSIKDKKEIADDIKLSSSY